MIYLIGAEVREGVTTTRAEAQGAGWGKCPRFSPALLSYAGASHWPNSISHTSKRSASWSGTERSREGQRITIRWTMGSLWETLEHLNHQIKMFLKYLIVHIETLKLHQQERDGKTIPLGGQPGGAELHVAVSIPCFFFQFAPQFLACGFHLCGHLMAEICPLHLSSHLHF